MEQLTIPTAPPIHSLSRADEIFISCQRIVYASRRPASVREVQEQCGLATATTRAILEGLCRDGLLWRLPLLEGDYEVRHAKRGFVPADDPIVDAMGITECHVEGCNRIPRIRLVRSGLEFRLCRQHARGFDERAGRGFEDDTEESAWANARAGGRFSSAESCGGWEPPDAPSY